MNYDTHPMELKWALSALSEYPKPDLHQEGEVISIMVPSYESYKNGLIDKDGAFIVRFNATALDCSFKDISFRAKLYGRDNVRHNMWMEWVLVQPLDKPSVNVYSALTD